MAKKTIKYLENGEYHDATVKDVGVIEELKTESKDNLVEAINEIFLGGGKGFSDLQQKVDESTQAAQNAQQATDNLQQRLEEVANAGLSDEEAQKIINQAVEDAKRAQAEALQAYKDAQKELDDSMAQFMEEQKAINKELEQAKADIQGDIDQKNTEIEQINAVIESTKSDLTATSAQLASVRNDLTNAQMDWGKVRTEITNINGKLDSKMSNTDFDEYKERIEHNETEITQTKNELQSKATKQDLDVLTGTVTTQGSNITQLAGKLEGKVSKDTLANDIDDFQVKKANIFTGTREFMGWEFSDKALGRVNDDSYNHTKVAELHNGSNLSITVDGLEVGKTYSVSIFAKVSTNSNTSGVRVTVDNGKSYSGLMKTVYTPHDTKVTTDWQRYYATIVASATTMKFVFDRSGMTSDITLYLNRPKLEVGETVYAWEDNAQDIYKRVEHTEAQFDVYDDQISGIVQRQTETDKKIENVSTTLTQRADGIEANSKKYTDDKATGLAEEFSGKLKATSQELSAEYEKQTNAKIGALSDGGSNLILNSSFLVTDNNGNATLENWRDTSSKVSLTKPNGLDGTWIKVNRATTGTALGARSNYFPVKQGKLVVGVDVALDGTGNISPYVLRIEYYDVSNNRVNYEDITLQKLGLSASQITKSGSNFRYARGVYKTSNDRSDVAKACIVVPETITGYDMYLTNFFAKFSDVNDGTYEVNPLDQQASLIKQRTKIEQDSEKINLLNTQTEKLGNDIKATNTSVSVLKEEVDLKASQSTVNDLINRVAKNTADIKVFPDKIKSEVSEVSKKIDGVNSKVDGIQVGGTNLMRNTTRDYVKFTGGGWAVGYPTSNQQSSDVEVEGGGTYTFSAWVKNDSSSAGRIDLEIYQWNANGENKQNGSSSDVSAWVSPGEEKRLVFTKTLLSDTTNISLHARGRDNNGTVTYWTKMAQVEKGTIATDWSPAPEDTDASIESVKTVATQTKDGFDRLTEKTGYNASTGEFSKVTTQINEGIKGVSTQVASVSNRLDNLSVGGTNLLKDSLVPLTTSNIWINNNVSSQIVNDYV
ncbi:coiled-coil domain-containing protein, partial [Ligilactobacillus salivarius]